MKIFKKIIGGILVFFFIALVIGAFAYNIYSTGWYFILSMVIMLAIFGLFILGIYLLSDNE
jgi:hypothetical protein